MDFNDKYRERTKLVALHIIKLIQNYKKDFVNEVLFKQLLRCSTSVAANFRAVCRARSDNERYAKLSISIEELDETLFWLEMLTDANLIKKDENFESLKQEALEILKVFSAYRKNMKNNK
jgi:four helix bundle protein